jgi:hypothetical protein
VGVLEAGDVNFLDAAGHLGLLPLGSVGANGPGVAGFRPGQRA